MEYTSKTRKLSELRAKTDRQLILLINNLLDRGLLEQAERLIPFLRSAERQHLELRLNRLKEPARHKSVYAA